MNVLYLYVKIFIALRLLPLSFGQQHRPRCDRLLTDRSFRYASPCLWNQLPSSRGQPLPSLCISVLTFLAPIRHLFPLLNHHSHHHHHSWLKTYLSHIFSTIDSLPVPGLTSRISWGTYSSGHLVFSVFIILWLPFSVFLFFPYRRSSRLSVNFWAYPNIVYRFVYVCWLQKWEFLRTINYTTTTQRLLGWPTVT